MGSCGRVSDKQSPKESGFFINVSTVGSILTDRGFNAKEEVSALEAKLKIPSLTKGKEQLSDDEVDSSRRLSSVQIHVERVIGRIKQFRLVQVTLPLTQIDLLDDIMVIACGLVSMNNSVVPF